MDFVITNMPTTINSLEVVPGISDHHAVSFDISVKLKRANKPPHKVYLHKNSKQDAMKANIRDLCDEFFAQNPDKRTVNENWTFFKEKLKSLIEKHIPSKLTHSKRSLPWITRPIVRMQRKCSRLLKKAKQTKKTKHMGAFKSFRNKTAKANRKSYLTYINEVIGKTLSENPKRFWSYAGFDIRNILHSPIWRVTVILHSPEEIYTRQNFVNR